MSLYLHRLVMPAYYGQNEELRVGRNDALQTLKTDAWTLTGIKRSFPEKGEQSPEDRIAVLFFPGNAVIPTSLTRADITAYCSYLPAFSDQADAQDESLQGTDVFLFDYQGLGASKNTSPEPKNTRDWIANVVAMIDHVVGQGYRADRIVIHGHSLGGALATKGLAAWYDKQKKEQQQEKEVPQESNRPIPCPFLINDRSFDSLSQTAASLAASLLAEPLSVVALLALGIALPIVLGMPLLLPLLAVPSLVPWFVSPNRPNAVDYVALAPLALLAFLAYPITHNKGFRSFKKKLVHNAPSWVKQLGLALKRTADFVGHELNDRLFEPMVVVGKKVCEVPLAVLHWAFERILLPPLAWGVLAVTLGFRGRLENIASDLKSLPEDRVQVFSHEEDSIIQKAARIQTAVSRWTPEEKQRVNSHTWGQKQASVPGFAAHNMTMEAMGQPGRLIFDRITTFKESTTQSMADRNDEGVAVAPAVRFVFKDSLKASLRC